MKRLLTLLVAVGLALGLAACEKAAPKKDPKIFGVLHVNNKQEIIFRTEPTSIGGACTGWNKVVVREPRNEQPGDDRKFCWKADDKIFSTTTVEGYEKQFPLYYIKERLNKYPRDYKP